MSTIIAVASGKGGVGKTLVTAALATLLHRRGHSVLAVDADMGLRNLDLMFGMQDDVLYDMGDIIKGRCAVKDALLSLAPNFDFLAASQKHTWEKVDAPTYNYVVETLSGDYEYTLIDCPAGRGRPYREAASLADKILFVVEPTWSSMRDTARLMQFCNKRKRFNYDVLFNNFYDGVAGYVSVEEMMSVLNPERVAGVLPHDLAIHQAAQDGAVRHAASCPFMEGLEQTAAYIESGRPVDLDSMTALLPREEGAASEGLRAQAEEEGNLGHMKSLAVAELAKAAAILNASEAEESAAEDEEEHREEAAIKDPGTKKPGLSLRQRRAQSMVWRHYRQ